MVREWCRRFLSNTARKLKMWILGGSINIKGDAPQRVANASLLIDADGKRVARYDKMHLFDVTIPGRNEQYRESSHVVAGREVVVADTPVGQARALGLLRHAISGTVPRIWYRAAPSGWPCRQPSPCRPARRTGRRC